MLSGRLAQELAPARGISPDEAQLAGLLHDVGSVVVIATLEDIGRKVSLPILGHDEWTALVNSMHVEFGAITAVRWNLPSALVDAIEHHHAPLTPLARVIELVDRVIAILDRFPNAGMTALMGVPDLTAEDRARIATAVPQVVQQMASFAQPTTQVAQVVTPAVDGEPTWPIDLAVEMRAGKYAAHAHAMSPNAITFTGLESLPVNWLAELTIQCTSAPIVMLANVVSCDKTGGGFTITARPYALGGAVKAAWFGLIAATRRSSAVPLGGDQAASAR